MPSNHLILCHPLLLLPSILPCIRVFSNELALRIRWPQYWSFSYSISPSKEHPGLISFRMDWLDLLAVQGTLKSLLQHHSSKASILRRSAFSVVQLSLPYMTTGKTVALTIWTFAGIVMSLLFNTLSRLVIAFLPRSKRLLISWLQSPSAVILEPKKIKSVSVSIVSSSICHEVLGPGAMIPIWPKGITLFLLQWCQILLPLILLGGSSPGFECFPHMYWSALMTTWWELSADLWGFFSLCAALLSILKPMNFNCLGLLGFQLCLLCAGRTPSSVSVCLLALWPGYSLKVVTGATGWFMSLFPHLLGVTVLHCLMPNVLKLLFYVFWLFQAGGPVWSLLLHIGWK